MKRPARRALVLSAVLSALILPFVLPLQKPRPVPAVELEAMERPVAALIREASKAARAAPQSSSVWGRLGMMFELEDFHGWDLSTMWDELKFESKHKKMRGPSFAISTKSVGRSLGHAKRHGLRDDPLPREIWRGPEAR